MNARHFLVLSVLWAAVLSACAQPEVKQTDDVERIEQIDRFIQDLRGYAVENHLEDLDRVYPEERRGEIPDIRKAVAGVREPQLQLVIDRIFLDKNTRADVALHWEFRFRRTSDSEPTVKRGNAVIHLEGAQSLRVVKISGDNPFSAPLAVQAPRE